ncbi:hypothetical protein PR003_g21538 [Phytophthora rubi]|uniref:DDE Tnp4 domain-containing protein n=2 Tax=Phytophthora rubi TaxID=129364 RepID=A0A6A4DCF0_9STRA|nr:hypothetical protein PR003_g21538 [Phytophthora rubi]
MPCSSARQLALRRQKITLDIRREAAALRCLFDDDDASEDEMDILHAAAYERVLGSRYFDRPSSYRRRKDRWQRLLYDAVFLNATEFLEHFRMDREAFFRLVDIVRDDPVLASRGSCPFRGGAELHMMVLLKCLGSFGNDSTWSKQAQFLGLGKGTIGDYFRRASASVLALEGSTLVWPDQVERKQISRRIYRKYGFVNCIGMADGTLFPLEFKPETKGEAYYSRKGYYAVNALVMCDDVARVRQIVVGWPGSVHDNRVWRNSPQNQNKDVFFQDSEYILGDSAFQASRVMIPAFKKPAGGVMDPSHAYFNTQLAKVRIKSEHCIGLVKTRFQYLKGIRSKLKRRRHLRKIIRYVTCACILHNLLIAEPVPEQWESEIRTSGNLEEDDELNMAVPTETDGEMRRNQLLAYLLELRG